MSKMQGTVHDAHRLRKRVFFTTKIKKKKKGAAGREAVIKKGKRPMGRGEGYP